ncbi:MAG: hypothetical protein ACI9MC_000181 [Kiritimatiellia bacterium]|jgi:hypothetical protein
MTARIDRMTALRRAAAPSLDFSLLPTSPAIESYLHDQGKLSMRVREWSPAQEVRPPSSGGERFDFPIRPGGHPTLQPFDAPMAAALNSGDEQAFDEARDLLFMPSNAARPPRMDLAAAIAAVETSGRQARIAPRTLRATVVPLDEPQAPVVRVARGRVTPGLLPTDDLVTSTLDLRTLSCDASSTIIDDEELFPAGWAIEDEPSTLVSSVSPADDEVDGELNAWMVRRTRARYMALAGSGAIMTLLASVAIAGLWVMMGRPAPQPVEPAVAVEAPVMSAPATPVMVELTVHRGDTFHKLMDGQGVDVPALVRAARPLHDMGRLEVGDKVLLVMGPDGETVNAVRYAVDARKTLVLRRAGDAWVAALENRNG